MKSTQNHRLDSDLPKLAAPAQRALAAAGIRRLEQLYKFSEGEIKQLHGIGPNAFDELRRALRARGFSFAKDERAGRMNPIPQTKRRNHLRPQPN